MYRCEEAGKTGKKSTAYSGIRSSVNLTFYQDTSGVWSGTMPDVPVSQAISKALHEVSTMSVENINPGPKYAPAQPHPPFPTALLTTGFDSR